MNFYIITDTHLGHTKLTEYGTRPSDFTSKIIRGLETTPFKSEDVLIHLGDFCIGNDAMWHTAFMAAVPCKRWFVLGNHDRKSTFWYLSRGWDFVGDAIQLNRGGHTLLFTHIPRSRDMCPGISLNIHGHLHNNEHRSEEESFILPYFNKLLAIENTNYLPVNLDKFIARV